MYTTDIQDSGTVSATDEERLPPGGFSLRHGFPQWFGRARRSAVGSRNVSGSGVASPAILDSRDTAIDAAELSSIAAAAGKDTSIVTVLEYIRSTFCEDTVLDSIPLEAAANP